MIDIVKELSQNFIDYAVAVNTDRALPDARSGLKPVARRIIYGAFSGGRLSSKPHVKSARVVGEVMGGLHPHGDASIYEAMVRLSQPWSLRYPLMDMHGNRGSINGDGAAAMRYTESRLSKISELGLLQNIKKDNVDFVSNYDDSDVEPVTLPAIFPNLLCNPNSGIGVSLAGNWASHNLREVEQAILQFLNGEEPMLPGPDFPTGGVIINKNDIPAIMKTGRGSVKIRSKYEIKKNKIIFTDSPYGVTIESIINSIGEVAEKSIPDIIDISNETDKDGVRIVVECSKGADMEGIALSLFLKTNLQSSFSYNQVALVDSIPTEMSLKDACKVYVDHNIDCILREAKFDISKAQDRIEIIDGLLKALEDIDNIIKTIKSSESAAAAKVALIETYEFSDRQAQAILDMKLSKLAKLEKIELEKERAGLQALVDSLNALISNKDLQIAELKKRLREIVEKFGDSRRTELAQIEIPKVAKEKVKKEVVVEKCIVTLTESGLIKRVPLSSYRAQTRGGRGVKNQDDLTLDTLSTDTGSAILIFTNNGMYYRVNVSDIPEGTNSSKGMSLRQIVDMGLNEKPVIMTLNGDSGSKKIITFVTKNGVIKRTYASEYSSARKKTGGTLGIKLKDGDSVASVFCSETEDIVIVTSNGFMLKLDQSKILPIGKGSMGVKAISLGANDSVAAATSVKGEENLYVFYKNGSGFGFTLKDKPYHSRGTKGLMVGKTESGTVPVISIAAANEKDKIFISGGNSLVVNASDIPIYQTGNKKGVQVSKGAINLAIKI